MKKESRNKSLRLNFQGIEPNQKEKWFMEAVLVKILDKSPSDSRLSFSVEKEGEELTAELSINSFAFSHSISVAHTDLFMLLESVEILIMEKLKLWKSKRFQEPAVVQAI